MEQSAPKHASCPEPVSVAVDISRRVCLCHLGNTYKYQAGNRMNALLWFKHLSAACQSNRQQVWSCITNSCTHTHTRFPSLYVPHLCTQVPANLMSFEWATTGIVTEHRSEGRGARRRRTARRRRRTDAEVGAFTAIILDLRVSDSVPDLTAASPATTALTRVPECMCACVTMCVCFGCTDYWTRTCTTPPNALGVFSSSALQRSGSTSLPCHKQTVLQWTAVIPSCFFLF